MKTTSIGLAVFTTSLAFVLVQLDVSIINVALATIESRLHTGLLGLQWVVDVYAAGFLLNLTLYGSVFVLGLYFQQVKHWSAWIAGLAFLPLPVVLGIANLLANRISAAAGAPATMAFGLLVAASGSIMLARLGPATPYALILSGLIVLPSGIGITVPVMTASLLGSVSRPRAGVASGVLNAVRQAGGAIGVALFGGLAAHGSAAVFLLAAILLVLAAAIAGWFVRTSESWQAPEGMTAGPALHRR